MLSLKHVGLLKQGKWILDDISWEVNKGEQWVLLGLNGAGKTALLHMLSAYHFPTKGEVTVLGKKFGRDPLGESLRQSIGLVSDTLKQRFYTSDSAYQIVLSGGFQSIGLYDTPTDAMRLKAQQRLKDVGAFGYADRSFLTLSQGERQRVMIARALMREPELLILDEPTSGLDFVAKEQLLAIIAELMDKDDAPMMLYVTHHVDEILPGFTHVCMLKSGRIHQAGPVEALLNDASLSAFFGCDVTLNWHGKRPYIFKNS